LVKLDDLYEVFDRHEFPDADVREHPERDSVLVARSAITAAVRDDEFLVECMTHELSLLERRVPRRGLVPFFILPPFGIRFAIGYWPPGRNAGAHEHTAWTITAVCHNELIVQTYDRNESYRRQTLVPKNRFDASAGQVGFIYEPCIHDPCNTTDRWSLSLHVSSPQDGEKLADQEQCLPILDEITARRFTGYGGPYDQVIASRYRQLKIGAIAQFFAQVDVVPVADLLERCAREGTSATRRFIDGLGRTDLTIAVPRSARILARSHENLALSYRYTAEFVALGVETPRGWVEELAMAHIAREAIAFCVGTPRFDVLEIPGRLTDDERWAIAEALEDTGLFRFEAS
jgi:hypothetical protein